MCHPRLWEALAGVSENSALLNPLRPHVPDCMAWPSVASLRARPRDAHIYEEDEREKETGVGLCEEGQRVREGWPWLWRQDSLSSVASLSLPHLKWRKKDDQI